MVKVITTLPYLDQIACYAQQQIAAGAEDTKIGQRTEPPLLAKFTKLSCIK